MLAKIKNFNKIIVNYNLSIEDSIGVLQKDGRQILLIVNDKNEYVGTVTDGDIRRSFLKRKFLKDKILNCVNKKSIFVKKNIPEVFILEIMKKNSINSVPVIENKKIIGLYKLKEKKIIKKFKESIVVLAGGKGKRLLPLTKNIPKGLIQINGKPILEHLIINAMSFGFSNFVFSVNHLAKKIKNYFGSGYKEIAKIKYITEKKPLGTAGSLSLLKIKKSENIIVMNCDIYTGLDFGKLLLYHKKNNADITVVGKFTSRTSNYGVLITKGKKFHSIEEKMTYNELINSGVYVIRADCLSVIKKNTKIDMNDVLIKLKNRKKILIYPIYEYWYDIGQKSILKKINQNLKKNAKS